MNRIFVSTLFTALAIVTPARTQTETRVVLGIEANSTLTPAFRKTLRESISAELRSTMEGLASYSVIDLANTRPEDQLPSWTRAFSQPLDKLTTADDTTKTHYVSVSMANGQYTVKSRWAEASLGWVSPEVHTDRTPDREAISRLILSQLVRDAGLVGLIDSSDGDHSATLRIPNIDVSNPRLASWIHPGDLFSVMQSSGEGQFTRLPNVLLRATREPSQGKVECRIESRYVKPLEGWQAGRFRAVKLPATQGKVRLQVTANDPSVVDALTVRISPTAFDRSESVKEVGTIRRGRFTSADSYDRIAFVRLMAGDRVVAQVVPVEVLRDAPVFIEVRADASTDGQLPADVDLRLLRSRVIELLMQITEDNSQTRTLIEKRKNNDAMDRVNQTLARLDDRLPRLTLEAAALRKRADLANGLVELDRGLRDLSDAQKSLQKLKSTLEKAIAASDSPEAVKRRAALELQIAQADRAVDEADYDKAIVMYEEVLREQSEWPEAKRRLHELKQGWRVVSDEHRTARAAIYETFAKCTTAEEVTKNIEGAKNAFVICKNVGDRYTARKLYLLLQSFAGVLAQKGEELRSAQGDDAQRQREQLRLTSMAATDLLTQVENYLRAK